MFLRKSGTPSVSETPGSARRVLDSIEKSFHRVRYVLTPKKQNPDTSYQLQILTTKVCCGTNVK